MSEQKNNIPLVRLGDVAKWLRAGDWVRTKFGKSWAIGTVHERCVLTQEGVRVSCEERVELLSPRLELVPVGGFIKAGTPYSYLAGGEWGDFEPHVEDFVNRCDDSYYQLVRDEPEQLPREVVAGPETLATELPVTKSCRDCGLPFWAGRKEYAEWGACGDCWYSTGDSLDTRIATARRELAESAPDPHAHLTPAQRYHVDDDADASGIPEHN